MAWKRMIEQLAGWMGLRIEALLHADRDPSIAGLVLDSPPPGCTMEGKEDEWCSQFLFPSER